jgi:hypothetical protein
VIETTPLASVAKRRIFAAAGPRAEADAAASADQPREDDAAHSSAYRRSVIVGA